MLETQTDTNKSLNLNGTERKANMENSEGKADLIQQNKSRFWFPATLSRNAWLNTGHTARRSQGAWLPVKHPSVS